MTLDTATEEAARRVQIARHALELEVEAMLADPVVRFTIPADRLTVLTAVLQASRTAAAEFHSLLRSQP